MYWLIVPNYKIIIPDMESLHKSSHEAFADRDRWIPTLITWHKCQYTYPHPSASPDSELRLGSKMVDILNYELHLYELKNLNSNFPSNFSTTLLLKCYILLLLIIICVITLITTLWRISTMLLLNQAFTHLLTDRSTVDNFRFHFCFF